MKRATDPQKPFSPRNVRAAFGLTEHELRDWRNHLPPFRGARLKPGQGPRLSHGQLLGFGVVAVLCKRLELPVRKLAPVSAEIFKYCESTLLEQVMRQSLRLTIDLESREAIEVDFVSRQSARPNRGGPLAATVEIPLDAATSMVHGYLVRGGFLPADQQMNLRIPLAVVSSKR